MLRRFTSSKIIPSVALFSTTSLRASSSSANDETKKYLLVSGSNHDMAIRPVSVSDTAFSDIVGSSESSHVKNPERISAGDLLGLIDASAAQSAARHVFGRSFNRVGKSSSGSGQKEETSTAVERGVTSVTTVSFQEIVMAQPIMNGDFLNLRGTVVNTGSSSLDVHVSVESLQFPHVPGERSVVHVADAYASFVAIGKDLRPVKAVPRLGHEEKTSIRRGQRAAFLKQHTTTQQQAELETSKIQSIEECRELGLQLKNEIQNLYTQIRFGGDHGAHNISGFSRPTCSHNTSEKFRPCVSMKDSTLEAHRFFLQGFQNMHSSIFGGEILRWMEKHAVYCGRRFACSTDVHTLALHSVQFHEPIFFTDAVSLKARVVNVRNTTLEVDVEVYVDRADGRHLTSNRASFVLVSLTNFGKPRPINIDLDMTNATLDEWVAHINAMKRYKRHAACRAEAVLTKSDVKK